MVGCFGDEQLSGCIPDFQSALIFSLPLVPVSQRLAAATAVVTFIAKRQNWLSNGLRWIPFLDDDSQTDNRRRRETVESDMGTQFNVRVLLADEKILNITNGTVLPTTNGQSLDQAIESLSNAVRNGDLSQIPLVVDDTRITLEISSVGQCMDIMCNSTEVKELARAPEPSNRGSSTAYYKTEVFTIIALTTIMVIVYMLSL